MFDHPLEVVHTTRAARRALARPGRSGGTSRAAASASISAAAIARSRRSSTAAWSSAKRPCGIRITSRIRSTTSTASWTRSRKAAAHLPRVDAIGGSAAGVYVNNRVKAGSLFRGVPQDAVRRAREGPVPRNPASAWHDVPFEVVNDGEVTALAGSMSLGKNAMLGIALGHQHRGRLRDRRRQHHVVAQRTGVRAGGLQPRRRRPTSGPATTAWARSISRSRPWAGCWRRPGSRRRPDCRCPRS